MCGEEEVVEDRPLPPGADDVLDGGVARSPPRVAVAPSVDRAYDDELAGWDEVAGTVNEGEDEDEKESGVLTGMGADGTNGILSLGRSKPIRVIAQNEETCVVYGMPKAIYEAGVVDEVVPLDEVAQTITKNVGVK